MTQPRATHHLLEDISRSDPQSTEPLVEELADALCRSNPWLLPHEATTWAQRLAAAVVDGQPPEAVLAEMFKTRARVVSH